MSAGTRRPLWILAVLLLGTAGALWGATEVSWGTGGVGGTGPSFTALALLALASLAGVFAVGGWMRRLLGAIIVVAGGFVCWRALSTAGGFELVTGRGLAFLGGVLFLGAGALIVRYATGLPTMGARYERGSERGTGDSEKDMWDDLSHGEDPTRD